MNLSKGNRSVSDYVNTPVNQRVHKRMNGRNILRDFSSTYTSSQLRYNESTDRTRRTMSEGEDVNQA